MIKLLERIKKFFFSKGSVLYINGKEILPAPLSKEEEQEAIEEYRKRSLNTIFV